MMLMLGSLVASHGDDHMSDGSHTSTGAGETVASCNSWTSFDSEYEATGALYLEIEAGTTLTSSNITVTRNGDPFAAMRLMGHVHNASCSPPARGGPHWKKNNDDPDGTMTNEVHVMFMSTGEAGQFGSRMSNPFEVNDVIRSVVIHDPEDSSVRLFCCDLALQGVLANGDEDSSASTFVTSFLGAFSGWLLWIAAF